MALGINHEMRDFTQNRRKNLDLVICRASPTEAPTGSFRRLAAQYGIDLSDEDAALLALLPDAPLAPPTSVLVAVEAKACMTEFGKARPRLYDELNSSHLTIHGDTEGAIAAGLVLVNAAEQFISPLRNPWPEGERPDVISTHVQPRQASSVVEKLTELPRRSRVGEQGFDALAITAICCRNNGTPVTLADDHALIPAIFRYPTMVERLAQIYATRFSAI